ncbi:MAG TPA: hypothetical protein DCR37_06395 [Glaciecola sp.]|nr:hypothetical protein [Glaciecola sp.]
MEIHAEQLAQPASRFWVWQLTIAANAEHLRHFTTIQFGDFEVKLYFTSSRFIAVHFDDGDFEKIDVKVRSPYESLLGYQGQLEQQLSAHAKTVFSGAAYA